MSGKEERTATVHQPGEGIWLWWLDHRIRYLATEAKTNGTYCASVGIADKDGGAPPHRHPFEEGFCILTGQVEFTAGNQKKVLCEGEFINISSMTAHYPRILSDRAELLTIAAPAGFDRFQLEAGEPLCSRDAHPIKSSQEIRQAAMLAAPEFDIDLDPPADSFESKPIIHVTASGAGDVVDAVGDRYRFLAEGEHTAGRYALWHATISPGGGPPLHRHSREEEMFYVLSGELTFEANGQRFTGAAGTFVNLPVGSKHRFSNESSDRAEVLILVAPAGLEKMFRRTGQIVADVKEPIAAPSTAEKKRLIEIAPDYGIELILN